MEFKTARDFAQYVTGELQLYRCIPATVAPVRSFFLESLSVDSYCGRCEAESVFKSSDGNVSETVGRSLNFYVDGNRHHAVSEGTGERTFTCTRCTHSDGQLKFILKYERANDGGGWNHSKNRPMALFC